MIASEFGSALINHLWQSTVVVGIAWLLTLALRNNHARVRYWVWFAASVKFLLPFSLLMSAGDRVRTFFAVPVAAQPALANVVEQWTQPFAQAQVFDATAPVAAQHANWLPVVLLTVWICGALVVAIRFGRSWLRVYAAKRVASPLGNVQGSGPLEAGNPSGAKALHSLNSLIGTTEVVPLRGGTALNTGFNVAADVPVLLSSSLIEPGIFGIFRPVLLMPDGILERLSPEQMQAIVAHEMCHVRRRDNLTFAIHMIVETLFWFHPAVWWIGARLIEERERACDESVVQASGEAEVYAEGILNVCKYYVESPVACVAGVTGADLKKRIVRIMTEQIGQKVSLRRRLTLGALGLMVLGLPVIAGWGQARVQLIHPEDGVRHAFEVATIKPSPDTASGLPVRITLNPAHFSATRGSVYDLIKFAYGIKSDGQLIGAPSWLKTEYFDVQAKGSEADDAAYSKLDLHERMAITSLLVQSLLADRFQLQAKVETRDLPVYALVVANGGIKMKEVTPDPFPPAGVRPAPGAHLPSIRPSGTNEWTASAWPMSEMTNWLSYSYEVGNRPVVDETGLKGNYDFVLSDVSMRPPPPGDANGSSQEPVVSIFSALPEQLGLKLVPAKAPTEVLVIDHVELPSAN